MARNLKGILYGLILVYLILALIFPLTAASTTTITLDAVADAYVRSTEGNVNHGSDTELFAANDASGTDEITYIKFDLSSINPAAVVISAKLRLWVTFGGGVEICVYRVTSDWAENEITWNTMPSSVTESESCINVPLDSGWAEWDITELVQAWINQTYNNYGVKIYPSGAGNYAHFASREYSETGYRPQLVIEYIEPNTVTQTITETQTVTETITVANTTITETQTVSETITTTQTINNTVYSTVTTTVANTTYYTTIYETISPAYGNETVNYYTDLANQLVPLVMVIGVICTMLSLLLSATKGR